MNFGRTATLYAYKEWIECILTMKGDYPPREACVEFTEMNQLRLNGYQITKIWNRGKEFYERHKRLIAKKILQDPQLDITSLIDSK